jgi:isocitrate dehydrogenase kinase/phosphatase
VRHVPQARTEEDEMSAEPWYSVAPNDIFPETYSTFLLGDPTVREYFMRHHADFFDPKLWQKHKEQLLKGELPDFFPYDHGVRFCNRYPERFASPHDADTAVDAASKRADGGSGAARAA